MSKIKVILKKTLTNPPILYVISRYATYIIQFINSLFIAVYLGPYYLGIWGFINLILGYLSQINFGISHSVNVIISVDKDKEEYVEKVIGNGLTMIMFLCILVFIFFLFNYAGIISIGVKYDFKSFSILVCLIAITSHFNSLFSNIYRVFGKIFEIALNQSLLPFLIILIIIFFRGHYLLWALVIVNIISVVISLIVFIIRTPINLRFYFDFKLIRKIQKKGWYLFVFNSSLSLIIITTKSFISTNYQIEEFGYFTFSYSLANAILLLLNTLSFLITPKMINRFSDDKYENAKNLLSKLRVAYISTSHFLVHFIIMIFPVFLLLFPDYSEVDQVFKVTALTIVLYTNSFGYQTVLLSRGKEKISSILALSALLMNVLLVYIFIKRISVDFSYTMFATMIVYFVYILLVSIVGRKELRLSISLIEILRDIFPLKMFLPFLSSILLIILSAPNILFIAPFLLYLSLNFKDIIVIKTILKKAIENPNFINI